MCGGEGGEVTNKAEQMPRLCEIRQSREANFRCEASSRPRVIDNRILGTIKDK